MGGSSGKPGAAQDLKCRFVTNSSLYCKHADWLRSQNREMASADQIKALLRAYVAGDNPQFLTVANQVAAREVQLGHTRLAAEIRGLIEQARARSETSVRTHPIPIAQPKGELASLLSVSYPKLRLSDMVLPSEMRGRLERVIKEQRRASHIRSHGLWPSRKMLLIGPPGAGKTFSAAVLAGELSLPLFVVRLESLITRFMGETAAKLRVVFDNIAQVRGVYLFDEFDSIGSQRGIRNEVGEIRRVLNSFLQFIEGDESHSLVLAATNHPEILDQALFRRFDEILEYKLPDRKLRTELLKNKLASVNSASLNWKMLTDRTEGMSQAEIVRAADNAVKAMLIADRTRLTEADITSAIDERKLERR